VGGGARARHTVHLRDRERPRGPRRRRDRDGAGRPPPLHGRRRSPARPQRGEGNLQTVRVRSHLVVTSRAAGLEPPIDSVYPRLDDKAGLREEAAFARSLGFFGKSAIHPGQLPIIHEAFTPTEHELAWAREVVDAFDSSGGDALQLPSGEFVRRARGRARRPDARARRGADADTTVARRERLRTRRARSAGTTRRL
jgi:citrate lyase beta subunit